MIHHVPGCPSPTRRCTCSYGQADPVERAFGVRGEVRVSDLTRELGLPQSTASMHVACLRDCGLVEGRSQGRSVYYSLSRPELMDMLAQAEILLASTGNAVSLCPNYGPDSTTAPMSEQENAR